MFILNFIKNNWKFFIVVGILVVFALKGVNVEVQNISRSDSRAYSISDAAAYAIMINGESIKGIEQKTDVIQRCAAMSWTKLWCSEPNTIDYKHYDSIAVYWTSFHDDINLYVKYFQRKKK